MKFNFALALMLSGMFALPVFAQVSVGRENTGKQKDFKKGELEAIKSKKTIFVADDIDEEEFGDIIKSAWTFNDYEVVSREDFEKDKNTYLKGNNAIWEFKAYVRTRTMKSGAQVEYLYTYYDYYYPSDLKEGKKGLKYDTNEIASIYFGGNTEAMWKMIRTQKFGYLHDDMYNYKPGYLKNYLQYVNNMLVNKTTSWAYESDENKAQIKKLKTATLYVPDFLKTKSIWGWKDEDREDPSELFKDYEYKYEFIGDEALSNKILNATEDFYYLMYVKVNSQKFVSVVNGKTGEIIYREYQTLSYQLKPKDLKELYKTINKAK